MHSNLWSSDLKIAIVHYWLVGMRGGEKVLESICELYPQADIFTHVYDRDAMSSTINRHRVSSTFIQKLPFSLKKYPYYLPLMPLALEQIDLRGYDLVISTESGPAKGVIAPPESVHVCYCHSPMRYLWNMYPEYRASAGPIARFLMPPLMHYLRVWDYATAARVDHFIANSQNVANRIRKYWRRDSEVIHPPVDFHEFLPADETGDFYLFVGQLVSYKRADLAITAFNQSGKKLKVVGHGDQETALRRLAGPSVEVMGQVSKAELQSLMARCKGLVFPNEEDFGIVALEAMAAGRPVIAYARGGALETVIDGVTGVLFEEATPACLNAAVARLEADEDRFSPRQLREHAAHFSKENFQARLDRAIKNAWDSHKPSPARTPNQFS